MRYKPIHAELFIGNRSRLCSQLKSNALAIFHSNDLMPRNGDQFFVFRQQSDFFYLSGIGQEQSVLILAPENPNPGYREVLFISKPSEKSIVWEGQQISKAEAAKISGIKTILWLDDFQSVLQELMAWAGTVYLNTPVESGNDPDIIPRNVRFERQLKTGFPSKEYISSVPVLIRLRMIKSNHEIELIKMAIDITEKAFFRILGFVKPGIKEYQIQAEVEHEFMFNGAAGSAYHTVVASGENACILHYSQNHNVCVAGDVLLLDFGAEYANYAADISRTIPVNGKFSPRQRALYQLVLRVQKRAIQRLVPGNTLKAFNESVELDMEREMISMGLLDADAVKNQNQEKPLFKKYYMHKAAHHLGLDVHDVYDIDEPFRPGMVVTCEPGIYVREENTGIRIENNILITQNGPVDLSANIPREAHEIEQLMRCGILQNGEI